ncbi:MAG: hypothetical protein ABI234_16625 [Ktedonobacteraceae bacterium]
MSKENDQLPNTWGNEDETETSPTLRDAYLNAANQNRSPSRSNDASQDQPPETPSHPGTRSRPRGVLGAGRIYEEHDEPTSQRSRTTRQAHDEALARVRQRSHQPIYSHEQDEPRATPIPPAQQQGHAISRREQSDEYRAQPARSRHSEPADYPYPPVEPRREWVDDDEYFSQPPAPRAPRDPMSGTRGRASTREDEHYYEEHDAHEAVRHRRTQPSRVPQQRRSTRRGRVGSRIFTGCLGGLLTVVVIVAVGAFYLWHNTPLGQNIGKSAYMQQINQTIALANANELIVKNHIGNVTINVDASASSACPTSVGSSVSSACLTSVRQVQAGSQSEAASQFNKIILTTQQISQGADPACTASSCVLITATLPPNTSSGGFFGSTNSSRIDLLLILPTSFKSLDPAKPYTLSASTVSGDVAVNGFNGILNLTGNSGEISVTHAFIFAGTCLQTMQGDITVGQGSIFDLRQASELIPCSPAQSNGVHPWFNITSGRGNVDITLTTPSTNVLLDANTNNGKIGNDFGLNTPSSSDGSASYHGPLLPNGTPTASLYVFTSTGNIRIHQQ